MERSDDSGRPGVGFIGLGAMGAPMAANILSAGYALVVNDVRAAAATPLIAAGAQWADTPAEVAARSELIFGCLPNLAAIEAVALGPDGVLSGIRAGCAYFDTSTGAPDLALRIHRAFAERGAHMLEAPVSGGALGARRARLAIWVGGDRDAYERAEPVLRAMGRPLLLGAVGAALRTKLVNNCASQMVQAAIAEVFAFGVKAGIEPLALWQALRQGAAGSRRTYDGLIDQYLPGRFDEPQAALRIIDKDMALALELAASLDVPLPIAGLARADIAEAMRRGWAERDSRATMLLPLERAGARVEVDPSRIAAVLAEDPPAPSDIKHGAGSPVPPA